MNRPPTFIGEVKPGDPGYPIKPMNDGGPAFPAIRGLYSSDKEQSVAGMSLRDYFAGQALVGLLSNPEVGGLNGPQTPQIVAWSYDFANAMLQQRQKEGK